MEGLQKKFEDELAKFQKTQSGFEINQLWLFNSWFFLMFFFNLI